MKKILIALLALIVLAVAGCAIILSGFDINKHRGAIEEALSKQTGHSVKFAGDLHIGLSLKGLTLSIKDVSVGNPSWASRSDLAHIKSFDLKVGLLPLLTHKIDINGLAVEDADILLETKDATHHNWDMPSAIQSEAAPKADVTKSGAPVALDIAGLSIKNSRVGLLSADGKLTVLKVDDLKLGREGSGIGLHADGSFGDLPIKLVLLTNADSFLSQAPRPVDMDLEFANYHVAAKGVVDPGNAKADFETYEFMAGGSKLNGRLAAAWGGVRPVLQGTMTSEHLAPADFKMGSASIEVAEQAKAKAEAANPPQRLFSNAPLGLEALKSADAAFDVAIAALEVGSVEAHDVKTKLVIKNGRLSLLPLDMKLGAGTIAGQINLDAGSSPARFGSTFAVNDVDLSDLIKAAGMEAFLTGKVKMDANFASSGDSLHELASNLTGPLMLIGAGGDVISTAQDKIAAGLMDILSPGGAKNSSMNCLVTRFIAQNGMVKGNGILVDTAAATAAGYGDIDLRSETLNLDFHTKPKLVNLGGLLPAVHIGGTLLKPEIGADGRGMVNNVGALLTGGAVNDPVPDVVTQQGQNACAYTLDHPSAAKPGASQGGVVQDVAGKAGTLLKGLFGQ